ncbi:unnamed protein product [Calypogeia fissa]
MRATMDTLALTKFEENSLRHPWPVVPDEPILIDILKLNFPALGYTPWDCLSDSSNFQHLVELVCQAPHSGAAKSMAEKVLKDLDLGKYDGLGMIDKSTMRANATLIVTTFTVDHANVQNEGVRRAMYKHRDNICLEALQWLNKKRDSLAWEKKHGLSKYERLALTEYKAWKVQAKPKSYATTFSNLVRAYMLFKGCTEAQAKIKVEKDSKWVDTSDEEDDSEHSASEHDDSGNHSEDHTIFEGVDQKDFAVPVNGEATGGVDTKIGEAVLHTSSQGPVASGDAGTTNLDELTNTSCLGMEPILASPCHS